MLPKILTSFTLSKDRFFEKESLNENYVLTIDGQETNLKEFREWIVFCQNVLDSDGLYSMVIWNAGKLSAECQGVLLKPLEEKKANTRIYLMVEKESDLLPTVISRCETIAGEVDDVKDVFWKDLLKVWRGGPGEALSYSEKFNFEDLESMLNVVIKKINFDLQNEVTGKRLLVLELALNTLGEVHETNVNRRMALDNFLICSWQAIKTRQQQAV